MSLFELISLYKFCSNSLKIQKQVEPTANMYNEQNVCNNIISQMLDEYNEDFFEDITALKCNYDDIVMSRCCKKYCLQRKVLENSPGTVDKSVEIVRKCRDEIRTMGREEKRNYFTPIINSFLKRKNPRTQKWDKLVICIGSGANNFC